MPPTNHKPTLTHQTYIYRNRTVEVPDGYLAVGYIVGVHGMRGELKLELFTDFPERFAPGVQLFIGEDLRETEVLSARPHQKYLLLRLAGFDRREDAETLRGSWLFVDENEAVELEAGSYWVHDIIGLTVQTEAGEILGEIQDVIFTGANEVYIVETVETVNAGRDLLLPAIEEVVRAVDLDAQLMTVRLLPGLLDEAPSSPEA